jgi:hypothetical protein
MIKNMLTVAMGFIPGVGPLIALGAEFTFQAITNPEAFTLENLLQLATAFLGGLTSAGIGMKIILILNSTKSTKHPKQPKARRIRQRRLRLRRTLETVQN